VPKPGIAIDSIQESSMKRLLLVVVATLVAGTASAEMPLFAAKCGPSLNVDSNSKGQVRVNGKIAQLVKRPDGQITAQSAGAYVDITPQGAEAPLVTYTAKDKSNGRCEILSFKAPGGGAASGGGGGQRESASERAGQGRFDAHGPIACAQHPGQPMGQCQAAIARDPGGTAAIKITRPDGRTRFLFFEKGKAIGADLSQADGSQHFRATKREDVYTIEAGEERYEILDMHVYGG
jgi:hypothetical protein